MNDDSADTIDINSVQSIIVLKVNWQSLHFYPVN